MRAIPRFLAPSILKSSQRGKFAPEPEKAINVRKQKINLLNQKIQDIKSGSYKTE